MIRYRFNCAKDHEFEAWFRSGRAFDTQSARGAISCPLCGDIRVSKAIMAPNLGKSERTEVSEQQPSAAADPPPDLHQELAASLRRLREAVAQKAEYVGPRFAEEARRIEAGLSANRGIYGEATLSEARALIEDGIAVLPLPRAPEEHN